MSDATGPGAPTTERRSACRIRVDVRAMYVLPPGCTDIRHARVRDLGTGGACILTEEPLGVGRGVAVGFFLSDDPNPLVAMARVVWASPGTGGHAAGLAFVQGAAGQRLAMTRLARYLEARLAAAPGPA